MLFLTLSAEDRHPFNSSGDSKGHTTGSCSLMGNFTPQAVRGYWNFTRLSQLSGSRATIPLLLTSANRYTMVLESSVMLNSSKGFFYCWALGFLGWVFVVCFLLLLFWGFFVCTFKKKSKRALHTLFFFSFAFSRIVLYSFHSSIDLKGEEAQKEKRQIGCICPFPSDICFTGKWVEMKTTCSMLNIENIEYGL